ncbi:MAG: methyltransferase domain-containing protein [Bacteroidetes bacterium]|nr:methyltransferase domain-containing protein [Bacteroidota bacterium]
MVQQGNGYGICGLIKRILLEYRYFTCKNWTLREVGEFWDSVTDYDDINENTYSYYRRFTNSWYLAKDYVRENMVMLDIQSRTGKGTEFWFEKGVIKESFLVDFSDFLLNVAQSRLKNTNYDYKLLKILAYRLPFEDDFFDLVTTYETIEHIGNVDIFMQEITRVLKPGGLVILTCPNILWEPVHWFAAIFNVHHSEGPHNFLRRKRLIRLFKCNYLEILHENTTIILPFNNKISISVNEKIEKVIPESVIRLIGLRRSFVLRRQY